MDAPRCRRFIDSGDDGRVEGLALCECAIERHLAQLRAHRRLRQLGDGVDGIRDLWHDRTVRGEDAHGATARQTRATRTP